MIGQETVGEPGPGGGRGWRPEEMTPEELQPLLEAGTRAGPGRPANDGSRQWRCGARVRLRSGNGGGGGRRAAGRRRRKPLRPPEAKTETDPFDEIDFGSFFDDYLDPGYKSPASEAGRKAVVRNLPLVAGDAGRSSALAVEPGLMPDEVRDAAESIIGNLDENGYLTATLEEIATGRRPPPEDAGRGAEGRPNARSGRRGRARPARVPAAPARKPQRQGRRGVADRRGSPEAARDRGSSRNWRKALGPAAGAHRDRREA